jgi:hypothetical protein
VRQGGASACLTWRASGVALACQLGCAALNPHTVAPTPPHHTHTHTSTLADLTRCSTARIAATRTAVSRPPPRYGRVCAHGCL